MRPTGVSPSLAIAAHTLRRRNLLGTVAASLAAPTAFAQADRLLAGATWHVGPGGTHATLAAAVRQARDDDIIEIESGVYRGDVAVITQRRLTLRGVGTTPILDASGQHAQGKGILVVVNGDVTIENLEFRGARVPHRNGAGIRHEAGRLHVRRCRFIDNQHGILTGNHADTELHIEDCLFAQAPREPEGLHHLLYVGRIGHLSIRGCRFENGWRGHLVKSRAQRADIEYNLIHDGPLGGASYEIDLPEGGYARVVGNVIGQSRDTQNPVLLSFGAERQHWPRHALHLAHNTWVSEGSGPAWFVRVWTERLGSQPDIHLINNLSVGPGWLGLGLPGRHAGNWPALASAFVDAGAMDWRLPPGHLLRGAGVDPRPEHGPDLRPRAEFHGPVGTLVLPEDPVLWTPGAYQR